MSTFVYVGWVGGQSNVYRHFSKGPFITKYLFKELRIELLYFAYPKLTFTKLCRKRSISRKLFFLSKSMYILIFLVREVVFKMFK